MSNRTQLVAALFALLTTASRSTRLFHTGHYGYGFGAVICPSYNLI
jgi:hypothetical protein